MRNDPATVRPVDPPDRVDHAVEHALATARADHRVAVLVTDGVSPFELSIATDVFGARRGEVLSRMEDPRWYDVVLCTPDPSRPIRTTAGFTITVDAGLDALAAADTVVVPMSCKAPDAESRKPGWHTTEPARPEVLAALRQAADRGARIVSFCSGAFTLAEAGLLDGRRATTHWLYMETLRARHPRVEVVPDVLYVDDGEVLTSAGSASGIDLALHIVRRDHGADVADLVARRLVVAPHRDGGQAQYTVVPEVPEGGTPFAALLDWMVDHLEEPLDVAVLADRAAMSERTFARRFRDATGTTPHQWLTNQRVARARRLLETTDLPIDSVAQRAGLGSAANLRARFRAACGVSPSAYRARFHRAPAPV